MYSLTHPKKMHGKYGETEQAKQNGRPLTNQGLSRVLNLTKNEATGLFTQE